MKLPMGGLLAGTLLCALLAASASGLRAQTANTEDPWSFATRRPTFSFGVRVRTFPLTSMSVMDRERSMATLNLGGAVTDRLGNIGTQSSRLGGGPAVEVRVSEKMKVRAELLYTRLAYGNVVDTYSGVNDPATAADERTHTSLSENTRARLWDLPIMLQYGKLRSSGVLSKMYFAGGVAARSANSIRSETTFTAADGTETVDHTAARPDRRNLMGGVVGIGFRFIDDFNINVTPEVRFTRWAGSSFNGAPKNQLEFGIAISY